MIYVIKAPFLDFTKLKKKNPYMVIDVLKYLKKHEQIMSVVTVAKNSVSASQSETRKSIMHEQLMRCKKKF